MFSDEVPTRGVRMMSGQDLNQVKAQVNLPSGDMAMLLALVALSLALVDVGAVEGNTAPPTHDPKGYLAFGVGTDVGIGRQLDFLVQTMHLAKVLDRTLIMPHLYDKGFKDPNFEKFPSARSVLAPPRRARLLRSVRSLLLPRPSTAAAWSPPAMHPPATHRPTNGPQHVLRHGGDAGGDVAPRRVVGLLPQTRRALALAREAAAALLPRVHRQVAPQQPRPATPLAAKAPRPATHACSLCLLPLCYSKASPKQCAPLCLPRRNAGKGACTALQMVGKRSNYFKAIRVGKLSRTHLSSQHSAEALAALSAEEHPVIVLMDGLPSPPSAEALGMQKGLVWSEKIKNKARVNVLARASVRDDTKFVGIHMRIGGDMQEACDGVESWEGLFENGAQGEGFYSAVNCAQPGAVPPKEACFHDYDTVRSQVQKAIDHTGACHLFVASDSPLANKGDARGVFDFVATPRDVKTPDPEACKRVRLFSARSRSVRNLFKDTDPMVDQYILSKATHFIGNCVSGFSAAVARQREHDGVGGDSAFFGVPYAYNPKAPKGKHDEL